jgi:DNA invertase Pin-like site-specific DNA recombinase
MVCFTETSRFGRNYIDCFDMLDILTQQKKCTVKFLSNGITLEGGEKMNPYTWMTVSQFFIQDEFLKRQIGYNTSNALKRKKEQGVKLGKRSQFSEEEKAEIVRLKQSMTCKEIGDMFGVNASTISRIK